MRIAPGRLMALFFSSSQGGGRGEGAAACRVIVQGLFRETDKVVFMATFSCMQRIHDLLETRIRICQTLRLNHLRSPRLLFRPCPVLDPPWAFHASMILGPTLGPLWTCSGPTFDLPKTHLRPSLNPPWTHPGPSPGPP